MSRKVLPLATFVLFSLNMVALQPVLNVLAEASAGPAGKVQDVPLSSAQDLGLQTFKFSGFSYSVSPVKAGKSIVLLGEGGALYGVSEADPSQVLWKMDFAVGGGEPHVGSLAYSKGVVLCAVDNVVYGVDAVARKVLWKRALRTLLGGELVLVNEGRGVAAMTIDNYLYVIDVADGSLLWHYQGGASELRRSASLPIGFDPKNNFLITFLSDGRVFSFDSYGGEKLWETTVEQGDLGFVGGATAAPIVIGEEVLLANGVGDLVGLDLRSGKQLWTRHIGASGLFYAKGNVISVLTEDGHLMAFDVGKKLPIWKFELPRRRGVFPFFGRVHWNAPVAMLDRLWVLSDAGHLLGVNLSSGVLEKSYSVSGSAHPPVLVGSSMYISTKSGLVIVS